MRHLNYPGDVRHIVGEIKGPDAHAALYRAVTAEPVDGGGTRVGFRPVRAAELDALNTGAPMPPVDTPKETT